MPAITADEIETVVRLHRVFSDHLRTKFPMAVQFLGERLDQVEAEVEDEIRGNARLQVRIADALRSARPSGFDPLAKAWITAAWWHDWNKHTGAFEDARSPECKPCAALRDAIRDVEARFRKLHANHLMQDWDGCPYCEAAREKKETPVVGEEVEHGAVGSEDRPGPDQR